MCPSHVTVPTCTGRPLFSHASLPSLIRRGYRDPLIDGRGSVRAVLGRNHASDFLAKESFLQTRVGKRSNWHYHSSAQRLKGRTGGRNLGGGSQRLGNLPSVATASSPDLCPLRRCKQAPGAVGTVQRVELRRRGCQLHMEAETPKHIEGVSGLVVDCRVTIETWRGRRTTEMSGKEGLAAKSVP